MSLPLNNPDLSDATLRALILESVDEQPVLAVESAMAVELAVARNVHHHAHRRVEPSDLPRFPIVGERRSATGPVAAILIGVVLVVVASIAALGFAVTLGVAALVGFTLSMLASGAKGDR